MAKATLKLGSGSVVTIEGTADEVHELLTLYGGRAKASPMGPKAEAPRSVKDNSAGQDGLEDRISDVVNRIKSCDEAEEIENQVLDKSDIANRCLLPLYIIHEQLDNKFGLTTGQISAVTKELGVFVHSTNVSRALTGSASKFVLA